MDIRQLRSGQRRALYENIGMRAAEFELLWCVFVIRQIVLVRVFFFEIVPGLVVISSTLGFEFLCDKVDSEYNNV